MLRFFCVTGLFLFAFVLCSGGVYAADSVSIAPVLSDVSFDVSDLFTGLINMLMPCIAAAIGFGATIWAIQLMWRKTKSVAK
ncbi:MAG: hypothetical protein LBC74_02175 [Planctomycetaceae bacterium]|jgi:hypothetical protein|nr:hypothetical protein [Planctomycetaceae bacterium]